MGPTLPGVLAESERDAGGPVGSRVLVRSTVPASLASIAERLRCPVCLEPLAAAAGALICRHGHGYDVARHGYVTLQARSGRVASGDSAGMVAARLAVQEAGHFDRLTVALAEEARTVARSGVSVILDVGAGTGHHLAGVLETVPQARGIAVDASRDASRRAARAHPRIAAVRADVWQQIPLADASAELAFSVFAPRNGAELARVVRPGGTLVVVTPALDHLHELAALHTVSVDPVKAQRLHRQLIHGFRPSGVRRVVWTLTLTRHETEAVLSMGPAGLHLRPDLAGRLDALREPVMVTASVDLRTFQRRGSAQAAAAARW